MDSISCTWGNNGNMLSDGTNIYTYDSANRLTAVNGPSSIVQYTYNGRGDRIQQTAAGSVTTTYQLDINSGLTQVLNDGTTSYTYGLGRISQQSSNIPEYFLGDALGSVRQLTNLGGAITGSRSYDPYGVVKQSNGMSDSDSAYGFTGEQTDATGMVYLRARYYNPMDGRFVSRDTREGDIYRPLSLNRWMYVEGNPINLADPSGHKPLGLGYMEGLSFGGGLGNGSIDGKEIVYDYATMTRARFTYTGKVGSPFLTSIGWSISVGEIVGFGYELGEIHSTQIKRDYEGPFVGGYAGVGILAFQRFVGLTGGGGYFQSPDGNIKGAFTYLSAGVGLLPFEIVGFETEYFIDPQSLPGDDNGVEFYADASGNVNRGKLISDILTGDHSPITAFAGLLGNVGGARNAQIGAALLAAELFEEYHQQYESYRCIQPGPPVEIPNPFQIPIP